MGQHNRIMTDYFSHCWGVFEGGGVRGAAHAGAYAAAKDAGVIFGRVAGTSAGSIVASLIAAGASPEYITKALEETDLNSFLGAIESDKRVFKSAPLWAKPFRWLGWGKLRILGKAALHSGVYSSNPVQSWLEKHLQRHLRVKGDNKKGPVLFSELKLPLHIVATDLVSGKPKTWSSDATPNDSVALAVRCSCSIPFFYQAVSQQDSVFVDGGTVSNLPSFVFTDLLNRGRGRSVLCRILAFRLVEDEPQQGNIKDLEDFSMRLANAMVDGAAHIQLSLQPHVYQILIPTGDIGSTDFDKVDIKIKQKLHDAGRDAVRGFILTERLQVRDRNTSHPHQGFDEKILLLIQELQNCTREFLAVGSSTYWLDFVFPSVLAAARRGVNIVLFAPPPSDLKEQRRHWLLRELGADVIQATEPQIFTGLIFDLSLDKASALLSTFDSDPSENYKNEKVKSYTEHSDPAVLKMLKDNLSAYLKPVSAPRFLPYKRCTDLKLFSLLETVPQYIGASFRITDVPVNDKILVLQQSLKEYKLLQIRHHISDLKKHNQELFDLIEVSLPSGTSTIITPPIFEAVGEKLVLIEGHARLFYCLNNGIDAIQAVVVTGVTFELPARDTYPLSSLKLDSSTISVNDLYKDVDMGLFRRIEEAVHPFPHN